MPLLTINSADCFYRLDGPEEGPVLVLAHALGQDHAMWEPQAAALSTDYRVLHYDLRGHGASAVTPGEYSVDQLADDALGLVDALGIGRFAFCGLSLGGMIGQTIAVRAPRRLDALVLANTSSRPEAARMEQRRQAVLSGGLTAIAETVLGRFFSPGVLAANPPSVARSRRTLLSTDPVGYAGCCAAVRDMDLTASLSRIHLPVLVISGDLDESLPWSGHGDVLAREIPSAQVVHLKAAHLSNLEAAQSFTGALSDFCSAVGYR